MALEATALGTLHASNKSSISALVKLWTCFHCKLDNDTGSGRGVFCSSREEAKEGKEAEENPFPEGSVALFEEIDLRLRNSAPKGFREITHAGRFRRKHEAIPLFAYWLEVIVRSELFYLKPTAVCGFGLFARCRVSFAEVRTALVGWLSPISVVDFENLRKADHPSLFEGVDGERYVLMGPLSLANHHCGK